MNNYPQKAPSSINTQKTPTFTYKLPFSHHHFHKHPLMRWLVGSLKKTPINLSGGESFCAFIFKAKPLGYQQSV